MIQHPFPSGSHFPPSPSPSQHFHRRTSSATTLRFPTISISTSHPPSPPHTPRRTDSSSTSKTFPSFSLDLDDPISPTEDMPLFTRRRTPDQPDRDFSSTPPEGRPHMYRKNPNTSTTTPRAWRYSFPISPETPPSPDPRHRRSTSDAPSPSLWQAASGASTPYASRSTGTISSSATTPACGEAGFKNSFPNWLPPNGGSKLREVECQRTGSRSAPVTRRGSLSRSPSTSSSSATLLFPPSPTTSITLEKYNPLVSLFAYALLAAAAAATLAGVLAVGFGLSAWDDMKGRFGGVRGAVRRVGEAGGRWRDAIGGTATPHSERTSSDQRTSKAGSWAARVLPHSLIAALATSFQEGSHEMPTPDVSSGSDSDSESDSQESSPSPSAHVNTVPSEEEGYTTSPPSEESATPAGGMPPRPPWSVLLVSVVLTVVLLFGQGIVTWWVGRREGAGRDERKAKDDKKHQ